MEVKGVNGHEKRIWVSGLQEELTSVAVLEESDSEMVKTGA